MMTDTLNHLCSVLRNVLSSKVSRSRWPARAAAIAPAAAALTLAALTLFATQAAAQSSSVSYAYSANNNSIAIYKVDPATGRFAALSYVSLGDNTVSATSVAILRSPTATFLYVATNSATKTLTGYSVNLANGTLTAVNSVPLTSNPNAVLVDPTNTFVYVVEGAGVVASFQTDINGALTALGTTNTGSAPAGAVVVAGATQNFVYTVNSGDSSITQLTVCAAPLNCSPLGSLIFDATVMTEAETLQSIAASPNGQFLYVADLSGGDLQAYAIDPNTGTLTLISGVFETGESPTSSHRSAEPVPLCRQLRGQ